MESIEAEDPVVRKRRKGSIASTYEANKQSTEDTMDWSLFAANINQLILLVYSKNAVAFFWPSWWLVLSSITLQIGVGAALLFRRTMIYPKSGKRDCSSKVMIVFGIYGLAMLNVITAGIASLPKSVLQNFNANQTSV